MSEAKIEIRTVAMKGQCIFILHMPDDGKHTPTMQIQMPTHAAKWLKAAADERSDSPNDFKDE